MILPLCCALLRPHLEYCIHVWSAQYWRDTDLLERVQRRAANVIHGMEYLFCEEDRLRELGLLSLEKRRLRGDLIAAFQCLKGSSKKEGGRLLSRVCCDRRGNGCSLMRIDLG